MPTAAIGTIGMSRRGIDGVVFCQSRLCDVLQSWCSSLVAGVETAMKISRQRLPDVERAPDGVSRRVGGGPVLAAILAHHTSFLCAVCLMRCRPLNAHCLCPIARGRASWIVEDYRRREDQVSAVHIAEACRTGD